MDTGGVSKRGLRSIVAPEIDWIALEVTVLVAQRCAPRAELQPAQPQLTLLVRGKPGWTYPATSGCQYGNPLKP